MMYAIQDDERDVKRALGVWAGRMAGIALASNEAYAALARDLFSVHKWTRVRDLSMQDRKARQALLLAAVKLRADRSEAGIVLSSDWLRLARHFGYDGRGTAGFFRRSPDGTPGLMQRHQGGVSIGVAGLARIDEFSELVDACSVEIEASARV
jgi:hypothetical protein